MTPDPKAGLNAGLQILLAPVNAVDVLREQGFQPIHTPFGDVPGALSLQRRQGGELFAWPHWMPSDGYVLGPHLYDHATAIGRLREPIPRGLAIARLAATWRRAWPGEEAPAHWSEVGRIWDRHSRALALLNPGLPHVEVDGLILGAIARRLRAQVRANPALRLHISKPGIMCIMRAGSSFYAVQGFGPWHVEATCLAADFVNGLPRRMPSRFGLLLEPGILALGDGEMTEAATIACEWEEQ